MTDSDVEDAWSEDASTAFIDYGDWFVPFRDDVLRAIPALIPPREAAWNLLELCCGEGQLSAAVLQAHAPCRVIALDVSPVMRKAAQRRLSHYGGRARVAAFRLEDSAWRTYRDLWCIASSLAVHHLDAAGKQRLLADCFSMLAAGGILLLFDLMRLEGEHANRLAARAWDNYVQHRSPAMSDGAAAWQTFVADEWNMYAYPPAAGSIDQPSTLLEHLDWGRQVGFDPVEVHWVFAGHALISFTKPGG